MIDIQLSSIVSMTDPRAVLAAARDIVKLMHKDCKFNDLEHVYADIRDIFEGRYPGYKKCNTEFHDFKHTTDVFLAMVRIMNGGFHEGIKFTEHEINLGMFSALFHDVGYIQSDDDDEGTGAKFTKDHVNRGMDFLEKYLININYTELDVEKVQCMLLCTDLAVKVSEIKFPDENTAILGKMLGTADLLGQMGDRTYLEKLLFLFYEFKEGINGVYDSEFELLEKTVGFTEFAMSRLDNDLGDCKKYLVSHFKMRWNINYDPYSYGIEKHLNYLKNVVVNHKDDYREFLKRDGLITKLDEVYGHLMDD
ncbi:MAG: hypothetical protein ACYTFY_03810 [Planctomycetota bacterium]|jgi:hypothetical protein